MYERKLKVDDPRVAAIRKDSRVGWGSCTSIDECWGDVELMEALDEAGITIPELAVKWAYAQEEMWLEQGLNAREGTDEDPQLRNYREWKEAEGLGYKGEDDQ